MAAPAQLNFVSSLFTSKIFLAQVVTVMASIASAAGVKLLDDQAMQQQLILLLDAGATAMLRWLFPTGPVSVAGPVSAPQAVDLPTGVHEVDMTGAVPVVVRVG